jgi:hypothetical protein
MSKASEAKAEQEAQAAQAAVNDPSVGEAKNAPTPTLKPLDEAVKDGYLGYSPARAAAGGAADKGLSQQSILNG